MANLRLRFTLGLSILCGAATGQEIRDFSIPVRDWSAPPSWTADRAGGARSAQSPEEAQATVPTSPLPFFGIKPCRIADTRSAAFPAGYGPPVMSANVSRDFVLAGRCAIPATAQAVSLNITVTGTQGIGYILIYPKGGNAPGVSTLNYVLGQTIANAAIVPLGADGGVTVVAVVAGTHLLIDTNGYYAGSASGAESTFLGEGAGNFTSTGTSNTGLGELALGSVTSGVDNTGVGARALFSSTTGANNTAVGAVAMEGNTTGFNNVAIGAAAMRFSSGSNNVAIGLFSLLNDSTGSANCAIGRESLVDNTTGSDNTGVGFQPLSSNVGGDDNTALGYGALFASVNGSNSTAIGSLALQSSTGNGNLALGFAAGSQLQSGSDNIYVGDIGVAIESNTMRLGRPGTTAATYLSGVRGVATASSDAVPVVIDSFGQLGTISSSVRFKEQIEDMGDASDALLKLRPVTFRWRAKPDAPRQFGLIAEEVEKVVPELVVHSKDGQAETVLYQELPAMLLNEIQKQEKEIADLRARLAALEDAARARSEK